MQEHYTRLSIDHYSKKGKPIYGFRCHICNHNYSNSNNAAAHCSSCLKRMENTKQQRAFPILEALHINPPNLPEEAVEPVTVKSRTSPGGPLSLEHKALVELIADMNIPYSQIESPTWEAFIHSLNPGIKIPKKDKLHDIIIDHGKNLVKEGIESFRGLMCGLAVDGATLLEWHTYAFILVHPHGLRLAGLKIVDNQQGRTLAQATADVLRTCQEIGVSISGIVSDNAPSLVSALTNMDPNDPFSIKSLIGMAILRCSCAAHTGQLAVHDVVQESATLGAFFSQITSLLKWIDKNSIDFKKTCPLKVPKFIATRWNTLASCGTFIVNHKQEVNNFINEMVQSKNERYQAELTAFQDGRKRTMPDEPDLPPIRTVPNEWTDYTAALNVIARFTDQIEGDLHLQQQVYVAFISAQAELERMRERRNIVARNLLDALTSRFTRTADLALSRLAFCFTAEGLTDFHSMPNSPSKRAVKAELKAKFLEIAGVLNIPAIGPPAIYLPAMFDNYITYAEIGDGEDPYAYWSEKLDDTVTIEQVNGGMPISLAIFANIALIMISLPASEAMVERAFSQVKAIVTDFNRSMGKELFLALCSIKLCTRYSKKYFLN